MCASAETGRLSTDFDEFDYFLGEVTSAVPEMITSVGGSISFAPKGEDAEAKCMDPKVQQAWAGLWADAGPGFYIEHLKRLRANNIQPYFMLGYIHQLEILERLIRHGVYAGPLNHCLVAIGGGACGRNPFDWMEYLRRSPQGSVLTWENIMRGAIPMTAMAVIMGIHVRVGNEDNLWRVKGERFTTVQQRPCALHTASDSHPMAYCLAGPEADPSNGDGEAVTPI